MIDDSTFASATAAVPTCWQAATRRAQRFGCVATRPVSRTLRGRKLSAKARMNARIDRSGLIWLRRWTLTGHPEAIVARSTCEDDQTLLKPLMALTARRGKHPLGVIDGSKLFQEITPDRRRRPIRSASRD